MILPVGAPTLPRGAALRGGGVSYPEGDPRRARPVDRGRRRGRLRPEPGIERGGARAASCEAIERAGYKPGKDVCLGLDVASSEFFRDGRYQLESEKRSFTAAEFTAYLADLAARYPIITIEDGMSEADWDGWATLTRALGGKLQLVGDDIFVTNTRIFQRGDRAAHRQRHPHQAEPDRHAHRDARRHRHGRQSPLRRGRLTPLRRDRGQHHRRHRGGERRDADQDRLAVALGPHRRSTTSCCASRPSSARCATPAARRFRSAAERCGRVPPPPPLPLAACGGRASWRPARRRTGAGTLVACAQDR